MMMNPFMQFLLRMMGGLGQGDGSPPVTAPWVQESYPDWFGNQFGRQRGQQMGRPGPQSGYYGQRKIDPSMSANARMPQQRMGPPEFLEPFPFDRSGNRMQGPSISKPMGSYGGVMMR